MPRYRYIGYRGGKRETGVVSSDERPAAHQLLKAEGLEVTSLREVRSAKGFGAGPARLSLDEKIFLVQNLGTFLGSGIPILEAFTVTARDASSPKLTALLEGIIFDLKAGKDLAAALAKHPANFDPIFLALVEAGQETGRLGEVFRSLADQLKQDAESRSRVMSALIYPAVVLSALVILSVVLTFFVLPRITEVFDRFQIELPTLTKILIQSAQFLHHHPLLIIGSLLVSLGVVSLILVSRGGQQKLIRLAYYTPVIRNIFWYLDLQRFTNTLAILLDSGIPIQRALDIAGRTVRHPRLSREIPEAAEELAGGKSLQRALEGTMLPHTATSLLGAGEQSGNLSHNLRELASFYQLHLDEAIRNMTALIEPVLTLVVGLVVGVVVIAIVVPIYQLIGQFNPDTGG